MSSQIINQKPPISLNVINWHSVRLCSFSIRKIDMILLCSLIGERELIKTVVSDAWCLISNMRILNMRTMTMTRGSRHKIHYTKHISYRTEWHENLFNKRVWVKYFQLYHFIRVDHSQGNSAGFHDIARFLYLCLDNNFNYSFTHCQGCVLFQNWILYFLLLNN